MKKVFIIGCPRSGSTWLTYLLSNHPNVVALHHSVIFPYLLSMDAWWEKKGSSYITNAHSQAQGQDNGKKLRLKNVLSQKALLQLLRPVVDGIFTTVASTSSDASVVIDKTPENVRVANSIHQLVPDAYFLHIVRDPRAVFCSQRAASLGWASWEFPTYPTDAARYWQDDVNAAQRIPQFTERYIQIRYEDLLDNGEKELIRLWEWLDLPVTKDFSALTLAANTKGNMRNNQELPDNFVRQTRENGWRDELKLSEVKIIEYIAGNMMESLGYQLSQPKGKKPWPIIWHDLATKVVINTTSKLPAVARRAHRLSVGRRAKWSPMF